MGWDKSTQERYPESWARVKAVLAKQKSMLGKKQSPLQKRRAKEANMGNKHRFGKPKSDAEKKKISDSSMGKPGTRNGVKLSEEIIQKMRVSQTREHWKYNKTPEEIIEIRRKIRVARGKQILPLQDTHIELILQEELTRRKIPFEKHKQIYGLPDIFIEPNICVFADGDYWHANPEIHLPEHGIRFGSKVLTATQIQGKDKKVTDTLIGMEYRVFRFWENEIHKDVGACIDKIFPPPVDK